jgi:hypothetical protein
MAGKPEVILTHYPGDPRVIGILPPRLISAIFSGRKPTRSASVSHPSQPYLFGYLNTRTESFSYGLAVLMFSALAGGLLILCAPRTARGLVR